MQLAAACPTSEPTRFPWLLLAIALAAVVVGTQYSHALERHKQGAIDAQRCFDDKGHSFVTYNPFKDSYVYGCQDDTGQVYYRVLRYIKGRLEEISKYPKSQCFSLDEGLQILLDQGAEIRWIKPGVKALEYFVGMIGR